MTSERIKAIKECLLNGHSMNETARLCHASKRDVAAVRKELSDGEKVPVIVRPLNYHTSCARPDFKALVPDVYSSGTALAAWERYADVCKEMGVPYIQYRQFSSLFREYIESEHERLNAIESRTIRRTAKVLFNYHIKYEHSWYSVPWQYHDRTIDIVELDGKVSIYADGILLSEHRKAVREGTYRTNEVDVPDEKTLLMLPWNRNRFLNWAGRIGPTTRHVINMVLSHYAIETQGYKTCLDILHLDRKGSLEQALSNMPSIDFRRPYGSIKDYMNAHSQA